MPTDATTETSILNAAIARIGSTEQVTSFTDSTSNTAKRAQRIWPILRRYMLAQHPWNFALKRHLLNEAGEKPKFGWDRQFTVPAEALRWLPPGDRDADWFEGEREGDFILTNHAAPLPVRCIMDITDVTKWSAGFVAAMEIALAAFLASPVTESVALTQWLTDVADNAVRKGKRLDGLETGRTRRQPARAQSSWLQARNRRGSRC